MSYPGEPADERWRRMAGDLRRGGWEEGEDGFWRFPGTDYVQTLSAAWVVMNDYGVRNRVCGMYLACSGERCDEPAFLQARSNRPGHEGDGWTPCCFGHAVRACAPSAWNPLPDDRPEFRVVPMPPESR